MAFICDCDHQKGNSVDLLRHMLADIYFHYKENQYENRDLLDEDLGDLTELLLSSFQLFHWQPDGSDHFFYGCPHEYHINASHSERIHSVQDYIYEHYAENITLGDLAKHEYLSISYLSCFIRQITGLSFQQWLSSVRCEFAEKLLVSTDKTVSEIALDVGFASTKYLFYHFKKWYDCTPSKYRELTAPLHSRLPHNYYSCDQLKAEKLLNSFRYESSHSGRDIKRGSPISGLLEKDRLPEKSDAARLKHFIKLLFLSGEICRSVTETGEKASDQAVFAEALEKELSGLPSGTPNSYEAFLAEIMHFRKISSQKET